MTVLPSAEYEMKPGLKPGAEIVGELMAYTLDDLKLAGHTVRIQCIAESRDQPETAFRFARKDPSA